MCGPAAFGIIGSAVSGIASIGGANSNAAVKERNAQIHDINAISARERGVVQADQLEDRNESLRATQRVAAAASGVRAVGSPAKIQEASARDAFMDEKMLIWNAETQANAEENQATAQRAEAKAIRSAAPIKAVTSVLGGLKSVATLIV